MEANNFRRIVLELESRYPGLGHQVEEGMAVAIDGEIYQDAYLAAFKPDGEIYLIPKSAAVKPPTPVSAPQRRGCADTTLIFFGSVSVRCR